MMHVGRYHEYPWGVQYCGGISSVPWGCSIPWRDIMMHVGGYHDTCGGYLEYCGECSVPWGELKKISTFEDFDSQKYSCSYLPIAFFLCA